MASCFLFPLTFVAAHRQAQDALWAYRACMMIEEEDRGKVRGKGEMETGERMREMPSVHSTSFSYDLISLPSKRPRHACWWQFHGRFVVFLDLLILHRATLYRPVKFQLLDNASSFMLE